MKKAMLTILVLSLLITLFSCQQAAEFAALDIAISADSGIEISLDDETYLTTLSTQRIAEYLYHQYKVFQFEKVTSVNGIEFKNISTQMDTETGYIEIPIYFRSNSATSIYWNHIDLSSMLKRFIVDIPFHSHSGMVDTGDELIYNAANAYRISIEGVVDDETHVITYEMPDQYNYNTVLGTGGDFTSDGEGYPGMYNYYYQKFQRLMDHSEEVATTPTITQINQVKITDMKTYTNRDQTYYGFVTIRIWIEGYDPDAYDFVINDTVSIGLTFRG